MAAGVAAALLTGCESVGLSRVYHARANDAAGLARELLGMTDRLLPELIPWPHDAAGEERAMTELGNLLVGYDVRFEGKETALAWMLDPAEVGMLQPATEVLRVARVLRDAGIPCCYPLSQGTYLAVPGPSLRRAQAALRADAAAAQVVRFTDVERPEHVYRATACSVPRLFDELVRYRNVHGRLPDAVVNNGLEGWMELEMLDVPWRRELGYDLAQCAYRVEWGGRGEIGEAALMLRERTVACLLDGRVLPECVAALGRAGIPVYAWMSQTFYLSVPERRFEAARRVLLQLERQLDRSLGVYPSRG